MNYDGLNGRIQMANRIAWIDSCKGFAMFLVVLAHAIAWMFSDWNVITTNSPSPSWLWKFVYAFHMPLLMFISGYLCARRHIETWGDLGRLMRKLAVGLLLPDIVMSLVRYGLFHHSSNYLIPGSCPTYWYLEVLFLLAITLGVIDMVSQIANLLARVCFMCFCVYFISQGVVIINSVMESFRLNLYTAMLPYFIVGVVFSRCCFFESFQTESQKKCMFGFLVFLSVMFLLGMKYRVGMASWAGVFASIFAFRMIEGMQLLTKMFSLLGRTSIQIYLLHVFVKALMPKIGCLIGFEHFSFWLTSLRGGAIICLAYQLIVASFLSLVIIVACITITRIMRCSKILSMVCFGRVMS